MICPARKRLRQTLVSNEGWSWVGKREVIFDSVGGAHDVRLFAANNGSNQSDLDLERQAGREAVHIDFVGGDSLRFEKNLLPFLFRELDDFILD